MRCLPDAPAVETFGHAWLCQLRRAASSYLRSVTPILEIEEFNFAGGGATISVPAIF
jgi:hypothetical protein